MTKQTCNTCFKEFSSIKSLEFHKSICIYYQYRSKYLSNVSDDNIKNICSMHILFNSMNIKSKPISKNKILTNIKIKYTIKLDNILLFLYDKILDEELEFYSYTDIVNLISSITSVKFNDIVDIVNTFTKCSNIII